MSHHISILLERLKWELFGKKTCINAMARCTILMKLVFKCRMRTRTEGLPDPNARPSGSGWRKRIRIDWGEKCRNKTGTSVKDWPERAKRNLFSWKLILSFISQDLHKILFNIKFTPLHMWGQNKFYKDIYDQNIYILQIICECAHPCLDMSASLFIDYARAFRAIGRFPHILPTPGTEI